MGTTPTISTSVTDSVSEAALECAEDADSESDDAESWCRRFWVFLRMLDEVLGAGIWWMGEGVVRVGEIREESCGRRTARRQTAAWAKVKSGLWAMGCYGVCEMSFSGVVCDNDSLLSGGEGWCRRAVS